MTTSPASDDEAVREYRRHLYDALQTASRDYDQSILTIAAATLAVSVTFVHDITPTPVAGSKVFLLVAWASLVASLVAIVISFVTSQSVLREAIKALDESRAPVPGRAARMTAHLNEIAGGALIVGLVLLGYYAFVNIT